jgi:hypothetical protein
MRNRMEFNNPHVLRSHEESSFLENFLSSESLIVDEPPKEPLKVTESTVGKQMSIPDEISGQEASSFRLTLVKCPSGMSFDVNET